LLANLATSGATGPPPEIDFGCTLRNCLSEFSNCFGTTACRDSIMCFGRCKDGGPRCAYDCGYFNPDPFLMPFIDCHAVNKCAKHDDYGTCRGEDLDADQTVQTLDSLVGEWWNIKGLECNAPFGSYGYDNVPCRRETISKRPNGNFTSMEKLCYDEGGCTEAQTIQQQQRLKQRAPGVYAKKFYPNGSKLARFRRVRVLKRISDVTNGDVTLVSACTTTGRVRINNLNVLSQRKTRRLTNQEVKTLASVAAKVGVDFANMCDIDNTVC